MANSIDIQRECNRLRAAATAFLVVVVTPTSVWYSVDPGVAPHDAMATLQEEAVNLRNAMIRSRQKARKA